MMAKCEMCEGTGSKQYDCHICRGTGKVEPEVGTESWAISKVKEGCRVEGCRSRYGGKWECVTFGHDGVVTHLHWSDDLPVMDLTNRPFRLQIVEGTYQWAFPLARDGEKIEVRFTDSDQCWHTVTYYNDEQALYQDGASLPPGMACEFRLKPTPPEPEIVEWPRCESDDHPFLRFRDITNLDKVHNSWRSYEVQAMKGFVNFTIPLPNSEKLKVDLDHVWWDSVENRWSPVHSSSTAGRPGYTQRIDARGVNMLRRTE